MICCVTPAERFLEETRSTLAFASRAKLVTTHATVNEVLDEAAKIKRLEKEIMLLRQLTNGNSVDLNGEPDRSHDQAKLLSKIQTYERRIERLQYLATTSSGVPQSSMSSIGNENASPNATMKRPSQVHSSSKILNASSNVFNIDVDSLRSFVLPMDEKDSHDIMMQKEQSLKVSGCFKCLPIYNIIID